MTLSDVWPREDRPLTVDDLIRLPDDGNRYELVDGILQVTPPPPNIHGRATVRLATMLNQNCPEDLEILIGNGVNLARDHQRVPDVIVVRSEWVEEADYIEHPPLLAIEVAAKSTRTRDRTVKNRAYEKFGIGSYWIFEPDYEHPILTAYELNDSGYDEVALVCRGKTFHTIRPFPITIVPAQLVGDGTAWKSGFG